MQTASCEDAENDPAPASTLVLWAIALVWKRNAERDRLQPSFIQTKSNSSRSGSPSVPNRLISCFKGRTSWMTSWARGSDSLSHSGVVVLRRRRRAVARSAPAPRQRRERAGCRARRLPSRASASPAGSRHRTLAHEGVPLLVSLPKCAPGVLQAMRAAVLDNPRTMPEESTPRDLDEAFRRSFQSSQSRRL